jgi:hypothetical protein
VVLGENLSRFISDLCLLDLSWDVSYVLFIEEQTKHELEATVAALIALAVIFAAAEFHC